MLHAALCCNFNKTQTPYLALPESPISSLPLSTLLTAPATWASSPFLEHPDAAIPDHTCLLCLRFLFFRLSLTVTSQIFFDQPTSYWSPNQPFSLTLCLFLHFTHQPPKLSFFFIC